jgi:hypothetical protein
MPKVATTSQNDGVAALTPIAIDKTDYGDGDTAILPRCGHVEPACANKELYNKAIHKQTYHLAKLMVFVHPY